MCYLLRCPAGSLWQCFRPVCFQTFTPLWAGVGRGEGPTAGRARRSARPPLAASLHRRPRRGQLPEPQRDAPEGTGPFAAFYLRGTCGQAPGSGEGTDWRACGGLSSAAAPRRSRLFIPSPFGPRGAPWGRSWPLPCTGRHGADRPHRPGPRAAAAQATEGSGRARLWKGRGGLGLGRPGGSGREEPSPEPEAGAAATSAPEPPRPPPAQSRIPARAALPPAAGVRAPPSHAAPRPARSLRRLPAALSRRPAPLPALQPGKRPAATLPRGSPVPRPRQRGGEGTAPHPRPAAVPRRTPLLPPQPGRPPAPRGCYLRPRRGGRHISASRRPPSPRRLQSRVLGPSAGGPRGLPGFMGEGRPPPPGRAFPPAHPRGGCRLKATGPFRRNVPLRH